MAQNFQNGKIYKITNDYNNDVYVGSTCDTLVKRFSSHKIAKNSPQRMNYPIYKLMNEIGFDRFRIELIENFPCEDKYQLRQREGFFIREFGTLNKKIECRNYKEWENDNIDKLKEYRKQYYIDNTNKIKEYQKNNVEKIKEYQKEYNKEWKEKNMDKIKEYNEGTIICECGCEISKNNLKKHKLTKKHQNLLNEKLAI